MQEQLAQDYREEVVGPGFEPRSDFSTHTQPACSVGGAGTCRWQSGPGVRPTASLVC